MTTERQKSIYIAGPMSGIPEFNFPAFYDAAESWHRIGWKVFNPANKEGVTRWPFVLELSRSATKKMALRLGEVALLETNRAKQRGTINVTGGYVMDGEENPRPASEVRYGDTIAIADLPNDFPRLITATTWQEDGSISITLEQPPSRVDAVIARLEQAVFLNS